MKTTPLSRNVPRLGLNREEVALSLGVAPNTVDKMVAEGVLPQPRIWHSRKIWRMIEIEAAMNEWPAAGDDTAATSNWRASA